MEFYNLIADHIPEILAAMGILTAADAGAGFLPDKLVKYVGLTRRIIEVIMKSKATGAVVALAMVGLLMAGCAGGKTTIGDGQVDEVEASLIRLAVGVVLTAQPEYVYPAKIVTSMLVQKAEAGDIVPLGSLDEAIKKEAADFGLPESEQILAVEVGAALKAAILAQLVSVDLTELEASEKYGVVIQEVLKIINEAATERYNLTLSLSLL